MTEELMYNILAYKHPDNFFFRCVAFNSISPIFNQKILSGQKFSGMK